MNVLFITADQWRGDCLSAIGHPAVRTPHLDRLAAEGVLFRRHFGQATPCGPSRASLLTGMYALNHRSITNGTPLDARHRTLADLARTAGYDPVLFGYTDTSIDPRTVPADDTRLRSYEGVASGFRPVLRIPEAEEAYFQHLADCGYGQLTYEEVYGGGIDRPAPFRAEHSVTAFLADRFLDWLEPQGKEPWFAHLSFLKPHPPFVAPTPWFESVDRSLVPPPRRAVSVEAEAALHPWLRAHLGRREKSLSGPRELALAGDRLTELRAIYFGLIGEVDYHLGRILDRLARRGDLDHTLVVFTADHGEMLGDHWMIGKSGFFPQAFHVPLVVRHPAGARGRAIDAFTQHVDLMPTMLDAIGVGVPLQCDGRPLTAFLKGETPARWRDAVHYEHDFRDLSSRAYERALGIDSDSCGIAVHHDGRLAYVHFAGLAPLAFDTAADPDWLTNIAAEPARAPDVLRAAQAMLTWRMEAAERRLTGCQLTPAGVIGEFDA